MKEQSFIGRNAAKGKAAGELVQLHLNDDPAFAPWNGAQLGEPVIVKTVLGANSYWLVPVELNDRVIGFVRVMGNGTVAAVGTLYREPEHLNNCPSVVTGITAEEALNKIEDMVNTGQGELTGIPVFVHDGPPGREAWLVEVTAAGKPARWIFVTPAFVYGRPAGELHDDSLEG